MPIVLSFVGSRYSGKTHAARFLSERTGIEIVSFADYPREAFAVRNNMTVKELRNPETKELYRKSFIEYCTEQRKRDPYVFVRPWIEGIGKYEIAFCDDLRYHTELQAALKFGMVCKIAASDEVRHENGWQYDPEVDEHSSETDLNDLNDAFWLRQGGAIIPNLGKAHTETFHQNLDRVAMVFFAYVEEMKKWSKLLEKGAESVLYLHGSTYGH